jgi:hypothetical protein
MVHGWMYRFTGIVSRGGMGKNINLKDRIVKEMRVLHLTLKKKWFDMIASGEKKEEYRELKDYWGYRLCYKIPVPMGGYLTKWEKLRHGDYECLNDDFMPNFETFDIVRFRNGYSKNAPMMDLWCNGIEIGEGKSEWGANGRSFIIKLGEILLSTAKPSLLTENKEG